MVFEICVFSFGKFFTTLFFYFVDFVFQSHLILKCVLPDQERSERDKDNLRKVSIKYGFDGWLSIDEIKDFTHLGIARSKLTDIY